VIVKVGMLAIGCCVAGCASGVKSPRDSDIRSISFSALGDSSALAETMEAFRRAHVPESPSLLVSVARMSDGKSDYFVVLTDGVSQTAADSLKAAIFNEIRRPTPDFARLGITLMLRSGPHLTVSATQSVRTRPEFRNIKDVSAAVARAGAQFGIDASVRLWILVEKNGRVERTRVDTSSGVPALDAAIEQAVRVGRFYPGTIDGVAVPIWISVPFIVRIR
jgi:TonB family protein